MRFAVVADIHGNLEALDAVLDDVARNAPDAKLLCAGDVVGYGPDPEACLARLEDRGALIVRGNHEELVLGLRDLSECVHEGIRAARFTREKLSPRALYVLSQLPGALDASPEVVVCHGDLANAGTYVSTRERAEAALTQLEARNPDARVLFCGHTHHAMLYARTTGLVSGKTPRELALPSGPVVINPGSVGQARDGAPLARWALLDLERGAVRFEAVAYDSTRTLTKLRAAGLAPIVVMLPKTGLAKRIADAKKRVSLASAARRLAPFVTTNGEARTHAQETAASAKASAVVVTYNSSRHLDDSLGSLRASWEAGTLSTCFVVDNRSADETPAIVRRSHAWCTLIESGGNLGYGRGANLGFARTRTPYVLLLNPDAALPREDLERLIAFLDAHPRAGAVAPGILQPDGRLQFAGGIPTPVDIVAGALRRKILHDRRTIEPGTPAFRTTWLCGAVVLFRRAMLEHVGHFDPRYFLYFEETDLFLRAQKAGWELWATGEAMATHAQGASAKTVRGDLIAGCLAEHFYRSRFQFLEAHYGFPRAASAELAELGLLSARAVFDTLRRRDVASFRTRLRAPVLGRSSLLSG